MLQYLFHGLDLSSRADTTHRQTDINGGTDTLVEQLGLKENLPIRDGDDVSWNVCRHIASLGGGGEKMAERAVTVVLSTDLGLNNGQCGEGSPTIIVIHLCSSLKETRVKIEDVSRVGLATWWTSQQERHLSVRHGLCVYVCMCVRGTVSQPHAIEKMSFLFTCLERSS